MFCTEIFPLFTFNFFFLQHRTKPSWQTTRPSFKLISQPPLEAGDPLTTGGGTQPINHAPGLPNIQETSECST